MEQVVLVDELDNEVGVMEKMLAHEKALLHRAFSIFVFNKDGKLLLQRRAMEKYHSPGLWTNTCCSHPRPGESAEAAAHRRLQEEMGFDCSLDFKFSFIYKAELDKGLTEHELDYVFFGEFSGQVVPNISEVSDYKYVDLEYLKNDINVHPENYTMWFKIVFDKVNKIRNGIND